MGDTKAAFSELWASLRVAIRDARGLLAKRWPMYAGICIAAGLIDFATTSYTPLKIPIFGWLGAAIAWSFYMGYDVLRLKQPTFRYTFFYIARLTGASFVMLMLWVLLFIILNYTTWALFMKPYLPWRLIVDGVIAYLPLTRFVFVGFLLAEPIRETNSFALSWSLTAGRMMLPTISLCLLSNLVQVPLTLPAVMLPPGPQTLWNTLVGILSGAIIFPWVLRWMQTCMKALLDRQMADLSSLSLANHD